MLSSVHTFLCNVQELKFSTFEETEKIVLLRIEEVRLSGLSRVLHNYNNLVMNQLHTDQCVSAEILHSDVQGNTLSW